MTECRPAVRDQLEVDLAKFAIDGLLGECRHPGEQSDAELPTSATPPCAALLSPQTSNP